MTVEGGSFEGDPLLLIQQCPILQALIEQIDGYLQRKHPTFFGSHASHPYFKLKSFKVIHDNLWGTNRFTWRELALIDSPILQRLRLIHQTGLAFQVYPSAHHTRFEHCLGVATIASRVFDALVQRHEAEINTILAATGARDAARTIARLRQEVRLAALLHDTGHSLFSHTSERVYQGLEPLVKAAAELTSVVGKEKGTGEVISFCIALSRSVRELLRRAKERLLAPQSSDGFEGDIDYLNVALIIVGRSRHPLLQFLGDIVSSGFDADKLDYLLRDAGAAGLPLRYDLDRYLYSVQLEKDTLADGKAQLEKLYNMIGTSVMRHRAEDDRLPYPYYEAYRLRLPARAMNAIEQIVICKLMLYSYIYHHPKVRAAEGLLEQILTRMVRAWRSAGESDEQIFERFLDMTDGALERADEYAGDDPAIADHAYRIVNRLLPREVYRLSASMADYAERPLVSDFLTSLQDREARDGIVRGLELEIGKELLVGQSTLGESAEGALSKTGVWVDVPKPPKFEDVNELVVSRGGSGAGGIRLTRVFPIGEWTHAYEHFRYQVRIFVFSEYYEQGREAAKNAMKRILRIESDAFYKKIERVRE